MGTVIKVILCKTFQPLFAVLKVSTDVRYARILYEYLLTNMRHILQYYLIRWFKLHTEPEQAKIEYMHYVILSNCF